MYGRNVMSTSLLEVSLLGVGTVLRLERDAWSMVKRLRQATNEYAPPVSEGDAGFTVGHLRLLKTFLCSRLFLHSIRIFIDRPNCTPTLFPAVTRESQTSNTRAARVFCGYVGTEFCPLRCGHIRPAKGLRCSYIFGIGIIFTLFSSNGDADSTNEHPRILTP